MGSIFNRAFDNDFNKENAMKEYKEILEKKVKELKDSNQQALYYMMPLLKEFVKNYDELNEVKRKLDWYEKNDDKSRD